MYLRLTLVTVTEEKQQRKVLSVSIDF